MHAAVEQLFVMYGYFFCFFASSFCDSGHCLAVAFVFLDLFEYYFGYVAVAVQIVVEFFFEEIAYEFGYGGSVGTHVT